MKPSTFNKLPLWAQLLCCLLVLTIVFLAIFGQQWLRVTAFNNATGSSISVWESFFIDLRVTAPAK